MDVDFMKCLLEKKDLGKCINEMIELIERKGKKLENVKRVFKEFLGYFDIESISIGNIEKLSFGIASKMRSNITFKDILTNSCSSRIWECYQLVRYNNVRKEEIDNIKKALGEEMFNFIKDDMKKILANPLNLQCKE